jgi:hypothetical protein
MLRGFKRVRYRVAVLPMMAANAMASEASRHLEPTPSARQDAPESRGRTSRSSASVGFSPTRAPANKLATAPKPAMPETNNAAVTPLDDLEDTRPARWGSLPQVALSNNQEHMMTRLGHVMRSAAVCALSACAEALFLVAPPAAQGKEQASTPTAQGVADK